MEPSQSKPNFKWPIAQNRSIDEPLVDFILLAEFDIDSGSTIRHHYPSHIPNCMDDWLAENMLPEVKVFDDNILQLFITS